MDETDSLRTPATVCEPDGRSPKTAIFTGETLTVQYQFEAVVGVVLHQNVPDDLRVQFETTKNLYLYAWFVYRFYPVAELHAYTFLELALRERFEAEMLALKVIRRKREFGPEFKQLLDYAVSSGSLKDENFSVWQHRTVSRAKQRTQDEIWLEARSQGKNEVTYDDELYEIKDVDRDHKYLEIIVETIPKLRNHYAHGSKSLDSQVLGTLRLVAEIINQIYPE